MKDTRIEEEILNIMADTIGMLVKDKENEIAKIENTMDIMIKVLDNDDVWSYSVGDVTSDELYAKVKEYVGEGNYLSHDIFMNVLTDWMFHLSKED